MNKTQFMDMLSKMPPLPHSVDGQPFDIEKSEALAWIMAQPGIKDWIWERAKTTERIVFDKETRRWKGVVRRPKTQAPSGGPSQGGSSVGSESLGAGPAMT